MDLGIRGEAALVLGGTKGLAFACARELAAAGVRVAVNGREPAAGEAAAAALGPEAVFVPGDLTDPGQPARLIGEAQHRLGPIRILVTNAGGPPTGAFTDHSAEAWLAAVQLSLLPAIEAARLLVPGMREAGFGRILNITSFVVKEPYPNMALSNAMRVALTGAMATLAREVVADGVTVNNVLPGLMDTGALQRVIQARAARAGTSEADAKAEMAASVPARRLGSAEDFGPACAFLCSRRAGYITAQNLAVDGGLIRGLL
jgi:3-oxoacyl-[acyl-carrier protein] reductase